MTPGDQTPEDGKSVKEKGEKGEKVREGVDVS